MEKTNGYYVAKYLKNNALVLICELIVVLLLSLICTIIMDGEPMWLAPTVAAVTYLFAEIRFMMAYVATNARYEHEMAMAKGEAQDVESEQEQEVTDGDEALAARAFAAAFSAAQDEQAEPEDDEPKADACDEQPAEQTDDTAEAEVVSDEDGDMAEPVLDDAIDAPDEPEDSMTDPNEEYATAAEPISVPEISHEQAGTPAFEEPEMELETLELILSDEDDMTMDADDFARDVVEIGEVAASEQDADSEDDFTF